MILQTNAPKQQHQEGQEKFQWKFYNEKWTITGNQTIYFDLAKYQTDVKFTN